MFGYDHIKTLARVMHGWGPCSHFGVVKSPPSTMMQCACLLFCDFGINRGKVIEFRVIFISKNSFKIKTEQMFHNNPKI